jgi:hypothetical protein
MSVRMKVYPGEHPEFVRFWSVWQPYARKSDGRGAASDTFNKQVKNGYDPEDIILGAAWHVRSLQSEEDRKFIQLASSWLNARGFLDKCDFERQRIEKVGQATMDDNVVQMTQPRPSEAERAAHVERMRAKLRGNA